MRRFQRRKSPFEYLLPFLIFVGVGVIAVLGFQLWNNLQGAKGDVYFYVAGGKAKLLQYGMQEWETAYSGTKLMLGDSVKTSVNSRGVLQFFNGTVVRMDSDTEIIVTDIAKRSDVEKIGLTLNHGSVWVNKVQTEGVDQSNLTVRTSHLLVSDVGTVFEVESNGIETVRVIKGKVNVQILGNDKDKDSLLDTKEVGVGQEMNLDEAILKAFQNRETPSVLMALSDQFKLSDWYLWNSREDQSPTDFSKTTHFEIPTQQTSVPSLTQEASGTQEISDAQDSANPPPVEGLQTPVITLPSPAVMSTDQNKMTISGTVGTGTAKIIVRQTLAGSTDEYTLSKFKAGETAFVYNVSEALGNYKAGENIYNFYAVDAAGNKTDSAEVRITYNKKAVEITDALTAPKVLTFNGSTSSEVTVSIVKVEGSVAGAEKVVVNGYTLSKFEPGTKSWIYFANEEGGNLKPDLNEYEVYAIDPQGNKSEVVKFTITYNKTASGTQETTASPSPAPSPTTVTVPPSGF